MTAKVLTFVIDGAPERRGAIPAEAFLGKLRTFISTIYSLDRAFSKKDKRQIELMVTDLSRNSPARVGMQATSIVNGYPVAAVMEWSFDQLESIYEGRPIDASIPQSVVDNIIELATPRVGKVPDLGVVRAEYGDRSVTIDANLRDKALALRSRTRVSPLPWKAGISRGALFGELRGVMDLDGERQFFIVPPSGPAKVQCIFPEEMRPDVLARLFTVARVSGFLHYGETGPFPILLEADRIEGVQQPEGHFSDLRGVFRDSEAATGDGWHE